MTQLQKVMGKTLKKTKGAALPDISGKIHMLSTASIHPNPTQPRRNFDDDKIIALANSITQYGILQPLTVRLASDLRIYPKKTTVKGLNYELIAGERRLRAAKIAGLTEVPCIIIAVDNKRSAELALVENLQREDLNIFEQAAAISALIDIFHMTQEQTAAMLGLKQSSVANKLRLLKLTSAERSIIIENSLTERHARALLKLADLKMRLDILDTVVRKELNVSDTEALVDKKLTEGDFQIASKQPIIKDIRIFYNTIDRAIGLIEKAGIGVEKIRRENDDEVELVITIKK